MEEDQEALKKFYAALRVGGGLILAVPQHPWLWSRVDEVVRHVRRYTARELEGKVRSAGFRIIRSFSFVWLLLPAMYLSRARMKRTKADEPLFFEELRINPSLNRVLGLFINCERLLTQIRH